MRFKIALVFYVCAIAAASLATAFVPPLVSKSVSTTTSRFDQTNNWMASKQSTSDDDCGCGDVIMLGKPTPKAKAINARQVLSQHSVKNTLGQEIRMDELLASGDTTQSGVSIVVFLRSLG